MSPTTVGNGCPDCHQPLARPASGPPWCPGCEWNLDAYEPPPGLGRLARLFDRRLQRLAYRLDARLYAQVSARSPERPTFHPTHVVLLAISALLFLADLGCLVAGCWLVLHGFPLWRPFLGMLLILLAVLLRPRLGRRPPKNFRVSPDEAPALHALVQRVAAAAGAPVPGLLAVSPEFNAETHRAGLRQVQTISIGMPLWIVLEPQARVALLAHELGHQVNGDPTRGLLVQPALGTFVRLAMATGYGQRADYITTLDSSPGNPVRVLFEIVVRLFGFICMVIASGLAALGARDHQRAEYLADRMAVRIAGRAGTLALLDRLTLAPLLRSQLAYGAERAGPDQWRGRADALVAGRRPELPALRQLTRRDTGLWSGHPPAGLRTAILANGPDGAPAVVLTDAESARIDAELAGWYRAAHRLILGTRQFRGQ